MSTPLNPNNYKALIFDLDDTLYPEKDYLFQVYYLLGQFVEYQTGVEQAKITQYLVKEFSTNGRVGLFNKLIELFELDESYMDNFLRLLRTAKLPLKLLLYQDMLTLLKEAVHRGQLVFILTNGNPKQQLNKIKQIEWHNLESSIKCYFCNETEPKPSAASLLKLLSDYNLNKSEVLFIGDSDVDKQCANAAGVDFERIIH